MAFEGQWAGVPGVSPAVETYEAAICWGPDVLRHITNAYIDSTATDPTSSTTFNLRVGLLMGQIAASGAWKNYSPTATDGSEVAAGVMLTSVRMTEVMTQVAQGRFYAILVGGPVQASKLIGLDLHARNQMSGAFWFDDILGYPGCHWFPWKRFQTKTANYAVTANDNFTVFDNTGATGTVTFTLPPIANGYYFAFRGAAAQTLAVTSFEGANIIALNNLTANTLTFSTGGQQIGAMVTLFSNAAGTKWIASNDSAGVAALTVS